jgi:hypothetical protein
MWNADRVSAATVSAPHRGREQAEPLAELALAVEVVGEVDSGFGIEEVDDHVDPAVEIGRDPYPEALTGGEGLMAA